MPPSAGARPPSADGTDDDLVSSLLAEYAASRDAARDVVRDVARDVALRDRIVELTRWLAARGARRFADRGEPFDDLAQVAGIGLLKAIERYDPAHGVPFGAYATPTIMGELRRYFRDHTWTVHVPRRAKDLRQAVTEANDELTRTLGRSPRIAEIAASLGTGEDAVIEAMEASNAYRVASLDAPSVVSTEPSSDAEDLEGVLNREVISGLLDRLPHRERTILYLRFFEELSQAQIAERIGTSQVHVGRLLTSSLAQLRSYLLE